jgi:hypothetical protein
MFYFLIFLEVIFKRIITMTLPHKNTKQKKEYTFQRGLVSVMSVKLKAR